jgi:hypothetical protein
MNSNHEVIHNELSGYSCDLMSKNGLYILHRKGNIATEMYYINIFVPFFYALS